MLDYSEDGGVTATKFATLDEVPSELFASTQFEDFVQPDEEDADVMGDFLF